MNPDWDVKSACMQSVREHMEIAADLREKLERVASDRDALERENREHLKAQDAQVKLFDAMKTRLVEVEKDTAKLIKVNMVMGRYWNTFSAPCCVAFNEAMKEQP